MRHAGRREPRDSNASRSDSGTRWILGLLFCAAVALRVGTVASLAGDLRIADPILDARYYLDLARQLSAGAGWPQEPLFFGALYPWLLSGLFRIWRADPLAVQVAQSILGLASLTLLYLAVRRDFGRAAGWAAAVLGTLCGPILAAENLVLMESVLLFLATGALWLWPVARDGRLRNPRICLGFGLTCGVLSVGRASFLLLPLIGIVQLCARGRAVGARGNRGSSRVLGAILIAAGLTLPLLPQTIHQSRQTGHFQFLTLNSGLNLFVGNNPQARGIFSEPAELDLNDDLTGRRSASVQAGRGLSLEESSRYWRDRALTFLRDQPGRAMVLLGRKLLLFLSPREIPQVYNFDALRDSAGPLRVAFVSFTWLLPLAAIGLFARLRRRQLSPDAAPLRGGGARLLPWLALLGVVWLQVIVFFAAGRYRVVAYPAFLGLAGIGVAYLFAEARSRVAAGTVRRWLPLAGVAAAIGALHILPPGYPVERARAFDAYFQGLRYTQRDDLSQGLEWYRKAVAISPDYGEAWHGMGTVLYQMKRLPEAAAAYREALQRMPQSAITHYALGAVFHQMGEDERAVAALGNAVRLNPRRPDYRYDHGLALARLGRFDEAAEEWRAVLRLDPGHRGAQENLRRLAERAQ